MDLKDPKFCPYCGTDQIIISGEDLDTMEYPSEETGEVIGMASKESQVVCLKCNESVTIIKYGLEEK